MFSALIESIASALAEHFVGKAARKGIRKAGKAQGWIALFVLVALFALLVWLGVFLIGAGVWPVGVLMLLIALLVVYITVRSVAQGRRQAKNQPRR